MSNIRLPPLPTTNHQPPPSSAPGSQRTTAQQPPRPIVSEVREQMLRLDIDELHPLVLEVVASLRERYDMETAESRHLLKHARLRRRKEYGRKVRLRKR